MATLIGVLLLFLFSSTPCKASACVGSLVITTSVQQITSPSISESVKICKWTIAPSDPSMDVRLIADVQLQDPDLILGCQSEYLQIFNGTETYLNRVLKICSAVTQRLQLKSASFITIEAKLKNTHPDAVKIQFYQTTEPVVCARVLTSSIKDKESKSYGYPAGYRRDITCTWLFKKQDHNLLHVLWFTSILDIKWDCNDEYVAVFEGDSEAGSYIGKYCRQKDPIFIGSGPMFVKQVTQGHDVGQGFKINYFTTNRTIKVSRFIDRDDEPGYITSPNFPYKLPWFLSYTISISAWSGNNIVVTFVTTDIGESYNCQANKVTIYDGVYTTYTKALGFLCGNQTDTYASTEEFLSIRLLTAGNVRGIGFNMTYRAVRTTVPQTSTMTSVPQTSTSVQNPKICGSSRLTAHALRSYLTSPGFSNPYKPNKDCIWTIKTATDLRMVRIVVLESDLEDLLDCDYDKVTAYDGGSVYADVLQVWCGSMRPVVQSTRDQMTLKFQTDNSHEFNGFKLQYFEVSATATCTVYLTSDPFPCGGVLNATKIPRELVAPRYSLPPYKKLVCNWLVAASQQHIQIIVTYSSLRASTTCSREYVAIYDGSNTSADRLGIFCNQTTTYYSSGERVTIYFQTDEATHSRGFKLEYRAIGSYTSAPKNVGAIVGGIMAALVLIIIIIIVCAVCVARKSRNTSAAHSQVIYTTNNNASATNNSHHAEPPSAFQRPHVCNNLAYSTGNTVKSSDLTPSYKTFSCETTESGDAEIHNGNVN